MSKRRRKRAAQKQTAKPVPAPAATGPDLTADASAPAGPAAAETTTYAPPAADSEESDAVPVWEHSLLDLDPDPVSERELKRLVADWRKGRATRNLWDLLQDGYVAVLAIAIISAMVVSVVVRAQGVISQCTSASCLSGRSLLPWAALFGVLSLTLLVSRLFGPVVASAAEGFWLMEAPIRRGRLLVGRLVAVVLVSGLVAAGFGALVAALTGSSGTATGAWALATGTGSAALVALAAAQQTADQNWLVKLLQWLTGAAGLVALAGVVSVAAGWLALPGFLATSDLAVQLAGLVTGVGAGVLVVALAVGLPRLERIRRTRLVSGGSLLAGMQGAMFAMDFGLMRDILVERQAVERGHVRPRSGRGQGVSALVWRDAQRLVRFPQQLIGLLLSVVVPYAVAALGLGVLNPFVSSLVLLAALVPLLGTLRVLTRTGGLARAFPFKTSELRTAAMIVPGVLTAGWWLSVVPAFLGLGSQTRTDLMTAASHALVTAVAGFVAAVRWVSAKPVNYNQPLVQTGFGAMPPGMMGNLVKGLDMIGLIVGPLLFGLPVWVSLGIGMTAFLVLRGGFDQEELRALQEEQRRQLAESQAGPSGKRRIPPPRR